VSLLTVADAAKRLKLAEHTIRVAIYRGAIPVVCLGRRVRIAEETLAALERVGHPLLTKGKAADGGDQ
jgi:excisionase family DNA binding protein